MAHLFRVHEIGGPEVLSWEKDDLDPPGEGEVQVRHTAIGLNFIDIYFRTGIYPVSQFPYTPGLEAAGVVESVGESVGHLVVGDRIAYASSQSGAYSEARNLAADQVVKLPDAIDDQTAASIMLKGMTAEYLLCRTYPVKSGQTILFHAIAGGVGLIACQWAKHLGATVIGTAGSKEKAELAKEHGCDHVILYRQEDVVKQVMEITGGGGVPVVFDSVGIDTFNQSLDCLQPRGTLVSFGQSSGKVPPLDIGLLSAKGSLYLTRPTLFNYISTRDALVACASSLFQLVEGGEIRVEVNQQFDLIDAPRAHQQLASRNTTGSTILMP
ncbi:MAG: quinone oxidoreductase [Arenicellales bacterium]|jgi:NADPH2:quinone reductase|nr:quinone oxidoreductase [Arenicellales bacterium]MDP7155072.1 quinone oxidoreductase [Arenicellales bacterium]MDP7283441.1 quinone oxidoreductase [Arenicellales bacterium]MDP7481562.1 quinone oxidoreductase [Arenicellales bacterium]MEE1540756.1 quinone oxidoreductase [Arenicellales bacterium]|tara:strand:+ start:53 stop:1030 length:978 start_codon:yes stop_codon:yes gene_type:complete